MNLITYIYVKCKLKCQQIFGRPKNWVKKRKKKMSYESKIQTERKQYKKKAFA